MAFFFFPDAPLDLQTDAFYINRKDIIEKRLEEIRTQPLAKLLEEGWIHEGIVFCCCGSASLQALRFCTLSVFSCFGRKRGWYM